MSRPTVSVVPAMAQDRYLAPDIDAATKMVGDGSLARILQTLPQLPALLDTL